jgi:hypothetical protein
MIVKAAWSIPLIATLALGADPGPCMAQVVIDAGRHHLGIAGQPEWDEFARDVPEGRSREWRFVGRVNAREATLLIRQRDVKLDWPVRLNGRAAGRLHPMEAGLVHAIPLPPGTLREGENTLTIGPAPQADDVVIERVVLDPRPVREALDRATLDVTVTDAAGDHAGLPCRITVVDDRGDLAPLIVPPQSRLAARPGVVYTPDGRARIGVPPGAYTIHATRGFEYGLDSRTVAAVAGEIVPVALAIRREVSTPGLVACDTHVHTLTHSGHGDATIDERAVTLAGEGVEMPVATDHDHLTTDLAAAAERMGVRPRFTPVVGDEVTTRSGHFNAFPFPPGAPVPDPRIADWPILWDAIRRGSGERIVVLNHPRDVHAGYRPFDRTEFNPATGAHRRGPLAGVDALEVINSGAMQSDPMGPILDWMALLNHGERITAVAASDSHDVARFIVGQGRTYIPCDDAEPGLIDVDAACRALRAGRALVSLGLLARITVEEKSGPGELARTPRGAVRVEVDVDGPSWSRPDRVELYANGLKVREANVDPGSKEPTARVRWTLDCPAHDVHLVAIASGPGVTAPSWAIARPYQPTSRSWTPRVLAVTNPVFLDADGDGSWTSPRGYAESVVRRSGTDPAALLPALEAFDESVAAQAAALCQGSGRDIRGTEFTTRLERCAGPVRRGFAAVAGSPGDP